jgi:hypothetical protein
MLLDGVGQKASKWSLSIGHKRPPLGIPISAQSSPKQQQAMNKPIKHTSLKATAGAVVALTAAAWGIQGHRTGNPPERVGPSGGMRAKLSQTPHENQPTGGISKPRRAWVNTTAHLPRPQDRRPLEFQTAA